MKINYNDRRFRVITNTENGETDTETVFHYKQSGTVITCTYSGGDIVEGHLLGQVSETGHIEMSYHQINLAGMLRTGVCTSIPEILPNGKTRLHESWAWTNGDQSSGNSVLEEI